MPRNERAGPPHPPASTGSDRLFPIAGYRHALPTSLRWRLAAWVAAVVLICTAIGFSAVYRGTGTQLRRQMDRQIAGDLDELARTVRAAQNAPSAQKGGSAEGRLSQRVLAAARSYVGARPLSAGSTLQFATVAGTGRGTWTVTNRPELFSAMTPDNGESTAEQSHENRLSGELMRAHDGYSTLSLTDVGNLRLLKRTLSAPGGLHVTMGVGEPLASVVHAQRGVARAFILAGILALAGALGASYLIGTRFSRPLRRMAAVAARVDAGDLHPRIHDVGSPGDEVRVLAEAFNHMLDRLTDAFASQRAFLADASHELRTPLTVIRGQLEVLAAQPVLSSQEVGRVERLVQAEIARITRLVDDLLLLAKVEQTEFLRTRPIELGPYVRELWDGITLLAPRRFELGRALEGTLKADPDRLAQALRNLVANAIEHTAPEHGLVRLDVERSGAGRVLFVVSDDGPGIPSDQHERVFDRFHRTDAARDRASGGTGLGLAIVRAIAEAHGGRVAAGRGSKGGVRIELELPGFALDAHMPSSSAALA